MKILHKLYFLGQTINSYFIEATSVIWTANALSQKWLPFCGERTKRGAVSLLQFRDLITQLPHNFAAEKSARINQTLFEYRWPIKSYNVAFWLATFCKYLKQLTFANKITLKLDDLHHVNTIRDIFLALQKPQEGKKENWNKNHSSQETNLRKRTFRSSLGSIHKSLVQRTNKNRYN